MTIASIQAIIKNNVDDQTVDVDPAIDMAIEFLSNFFYLRKIDNAQTVNTGDTSFKKPDRCLQVLAVKIGDNYIKKAELKNLQAIEDDDSQRWHIEDEFISDAENLIHLTKKISADDDGEKPFVWYLSGFAPKAGVGSTDLPERLEPLLISFATYFYYGILVSYVKNNKDLFPNMTLWDVIAIWDTWRIHSFNLLTIVQKQHFNLSS